MQQLISWSKNLAVLHFRQILLKLLGESGSRREQQTDLSESCYAWPCKSILDLATRPSSTQEVGLQTLLFLCKRYLLKKASKE